MSFWENFNMKEVVEKRFDQELATLEGDIKGKAFFEKQETETNGQKTTTMEVKMDNVNAFLSILKNQQRRKISNINQNTLRTTAIQIKLTELGYNLGNGKIDGIYWPDTIKAVKEFQNKNQLNNDGRAWSETISKLLAEDAKKANEADPAPKEPKQNSDSSDGGNAWDKGSKTPDSEKTSKNKEYKKLNLIKQFNLKKFNGSNWFYKREGDSDLYLINKDDQLFRLGNAYGCQKFLWPREDNWEKSEAWSGWRIKALKDFFKLKQNPEIPNTYTREGRNGNYAFDKDGNLYYAGIDQGYFVLKNLSLGNRDSHRKKITTIPDELKRIEI